MTTKQKRGPRERGQSTNRDRIEAQPAEPAHEAASLALAAYGQRSAALDSRYLIYFADLKKPVVSDAM